MVVFRLLETYKRSAAENMALDYVILEAVALGKAPNTFRFMRFSTPCVLVGYHQDVNQEVRVDYCKRESIEINRRITGGGTVYFEPDHIGWEIVAKWDSNFPSNIEKLYEFLCSGIVNVLRRFGLNARYRPKNDIEINARKISGTGGTSKDSAFLFQGTLLTKLNLCRMLKCLKIPIEKLKDKNIRSVRERITTLEWELGYVPEYQVLKEMIIEEMSKLLRAEFKEMPLTQYERKLFEEKIGFFKSDEWIFSTRVPEGGFFHSVVKTRGGLLRVAVSVRGNIIQAVYITGDFFAFPKSVISELEGRLKHLPYSEEEILSVIMQVLDKPNVQILGVSAMDIAEAIKKAVSKTRFSKINLTSEEADEVVEVLGNAEEILPKVKYILLPYCAKPTFCPYRYEEKCMKCNNYCDFGVVYGTAEKLGFRPITIINYEHLQATLAMLKKIGEKAWMGSCCMRFYEKHIEDFERIGLPALIVATKGVTCYDLGLEKQAYLGRYEEESKLSVDLLVKLLHTAKSIRKSIQDGQ